MPVVTLIRGINGARCWQSPRRPVWRKMEACTLDHSPSVAVNQRHPPKSAPNGLIRNFTTHGTKTPRLTKRAISLFFRVGCERQLLLYLYTDDTRSALQMPPRQSGRAGLGLVGRHGLQWQAHKVRELQGAFGAPNVIRSPGGDKAGGIPPTPLDSVLASLTDYQFLVEGKLLRSHAHLSRRGWNVGPARSKQPDARAWGDAAGPDPGVPTP